MSRRTDAVSLAEPHSMCNEESLWSLYGLVSGIDYPVIACEIGSASGGSAMLILSAIRDKGGNILTCIDNYDGQDGKEGRKRPNPESEIYFRERFKDELKSGEVVLGIQGSKDAAYCIKDKAFNFLFIDADHTYKGCLRDIRLFLPKMMNGATICGHDFEGEPGVKQAVTETFNDFQVLDGDIWAVKNVQNTP